MPSVAHTPTSFGIGKPKHPAPALVKDALATALGGLANCPTTLGSDVLWRYIAAWLERCYGLPKIDPAAEVIPVNGSCGAPFSFAQIVIDGSKPGARVLCPNPFYQTYEGSALLAGATPLFANSNPAHNYAPDFAAIMPEEWRNV